jgi:hypothetical protein
MTEHDELLLQRCVDGEISAEQRAELIQQLDAGPAGWKVLACSYMEDQLVARGIARSETAVHADAPEPQLLRQSEKPHWFHHPLLSVALSACVAFLGGVLISREISAGGNALPTNLASGGANQVSGAGPSSVSAVLGPEKTDYRLWLEADGEISRDLPVYDDAARFISEFERYRQQTRQSFPDGAFDSRGGRIQLMQLQLDDGRTVVIPFEETPISPRLQ